MKPLNKIFTFAVLALMLTSNSWAIGISGGGGGKKYVLPGITADGGGTYAAGATYAKGVLVRDSNIDYVSLADSNIGHTPASSPAYWVVFPTGPQGPQGPVGATGATGPSGTNGTNGSDGASGQGVPTGGTAGQVLSKIDGSNYNTQWVTAGSGSVTGATGNRGLLLTGTALGLIETCASSQILKWSGSLWECANDETASGGTGDFSTNTTASTDGEMVLFSGTGGKTAKRSSTVPSTNGLSLISSADYSAMRTALSLVPGTNVQAYNSNLTGINQELSNVSNPAFSTLNLVGAGLTVGTGSTTNGLIQIKNSTNNNIFTLQPGVTGAALSWTMPTAAPGGAGYLVTAGTDGVLTYSNPANLTVSAASTATTAANLSGTPALPNGATATTQAARSNDTKLATDAYVDNAASTIPQNSQSGAYTTVLPDAGKHIYHPSTDSTPRTFTIAANSSVGYPVGTAITFVNYSSGAVTIAINSDTLVLGGTGTTGNRTLAQYGVATAIKITSTVWIISGAGLT